MDKRMAFARQEMIIAEVTDERAAQDAKWGEQNHPDLSPALGSMRVPAVLASYYSIPPADVARRNCDMEHRRGEGSWFTIHIEELAEALEQFALGNVQAGREELVQLAATVVAHVEAIDRRVEATHSREVRQGDVVNHNCSHCEGECQK